MSAGKLADKWLGIDQPDPALAYEAHEGIAKANDIAREHAIIGGEKAIDLHRQTKDAGLANINAVAGGAADLGKAILTDPSLNPGTNPVTSENDLRYYLEAATGWQNNALKDAGVGLTFDEEINREGYAPMENRGASGMFGGRGELGSYLSERDPTMSFGGHGGRTATRGNDPKLAGFAGRDPLTNRAHVEGPTSTRGYDDKTMRGSLRHKSYEDFATGGNVDRNLLESDQGYQFRLSEGEKAIRRAANAGSGARMGATYKALMKHGQGLASQEYENAYNRAMMQYRTNRENRFREQDDNFRLQAFDRDSQMRDQDNRYRTDAFNRQSEMRDQDNRFRQQTFDRQTDMRNQDTQLQDYVTNRDTDQSNINNQFRTDAFNRESQMRDQDLTEREFRLNRESQMRDQDLDFRDAGFNRDTDIRNQDVALQDYLTNRDTEQINADRQLQDYVTNRETFNQNADRQLQDFMTNRETWAQNVNNVEAQVDRSFQIGGWAQSILNAQNEQFAAQRREFMSNLGQFWTGVGQWGAESSNQVIGMANMAEAGEAKYIHEATGASAIGAANARAGGVNTFLGMQSQQQSMDFQILGSIFGFMQGQGWI